MRKQLVVYSIFLSLVIFTPRSALAQSFSQDVGKCTTVGELKDRASTGDPVAERQLAEMYENGSGVQRDTEEAARWYDLAAMTQITENEEGLLSLHGSKTADDIAHALPLLTASAAKGDDQAMNKLAFAYQHGIGVERDYGKALDLFEKAAVRGNSNAKNNIGFMLVRGQGTQADPERALSFFDEAAALGNPHAMSNLGWMYWQGLGGQKSLPKAVACFRKAAANGLAAARFNLGTLYESGLGVERDLNKSEKLFRLAAGSSAPAAADDLEVAAADIDSKSDKRPESQKLFSWGRALESANLIVR